MLWKNNKKKEHKVHLTQKVFNKEAESMMEIRGEGKGYGGRATDLCL